MCLFLKTLSFSDILRESLYVVNIQEYDKTCI